MTKTVSATPSMPASLSGHPSMLNSMQELILRTALNEAVNSTIEFFDSFNRQAEPGSLYLQQVADCDARYNTVANHKTTLVHTNNFARSLIRSSFDHLAAATNAALDTGPVIRWSSLALTRSLIEASAGCLWLVDPDLDLETRLRRTNQMLVRSCHEMAHMLPDSNDEIPRLISVEPRLKSTCLEVRDSALKWAVGQGWNCNNGKSITRARWIGAIPSQTEIVTLASKGGPEYSRDLYSMLSGAVHSQPALMVLAISDEPDIVFDRAISMLDVGISFLTNTLQRYAAFMGLGDHNIDDWFGPVHATIQHIRSPEDTPLPVAKVDPEQCAICPDYQSPYLHRLALISHLCALLERNVNRECREPTDAPARFSAAVEFFDEYHQALTNLDDGHPKNQKMRDALGTGHIGVLALLGSDPRDVLTLIAASWSVLRSPSYRDSVGTIQGWMSRPDEQTPAVPYGNE